MIKTGICSLDQLKGSSNKSLFGAEKRVSITLYDKIQDDPKANELAERILLWFHDDRGAYKRTYVNRFEEFDRLVVAHLKEHFRSDELLKFQDVGVSDGRSALDLFEKISPTLPNLQYIASDVGPKVYVLEKGDCKVTIGPTGKTLEVLWPPFVFNTMKRENYQYYPLNLLFRLIAQLFVTSPLLKAYEAGKVQAKELLLFAPQVLRTARNDTRFILTQHDLLQPFKERCNVVRAMNVLNPSYFSESDLAKIINHIHSALNDDGLLITGSNQAAGTIVHGGIYKRTTNGFQKILQSGDGSRIGRLIVNM